MLASSFDGLLKFILIVGVVYFGLRFIFKFYGRTILRFILRKIGKRMERKFQQSEGFSNTQSPEKTTIDHQPPNRRQNNNDVGEYIDYEEID